MGAKLSRRKSESATGVEGVAAEIPATEEPETAEALAVTESNKQKPDEAEDAAQPKATEMTPVVDMVTIKPASDSGAMETITQAAEKIMSTVSEQIADPVEDIVNKGMAAMEAMMAAVSVKDDPKEVTPEVPEPKAEPLVEVSEATPKTDFSHPPEEPAHFSPDPLVLDDLLSQPTAENLLPDPVSSAVATVVSPVAVVDEDVPIQIDTQAPPEIDEPLVCMKQEVAPADDPLNFEAGAGPTTLNSEPLIVLGDMEQAVSTAVDTVNDLI